MKSQSFGVIVLAAIGLVHGLAISPVGEQEERLIKRNNWHNDGKSSVTVSYPPSPHPTPTQDKSGKYGGDGSGKDCDDNEKDGKGKDDKGKDGKGKDGKGGDGKGKDSDYPVKVDPPIDLPPVGVPINKPFPQFDTPPSVPPNKDGDVDGSLVDEYDPRVVLVGTYIERLARQTDPIRIPFTGDEGPVYNEQVRMPT